MFDKYYYINRMPKIELSYDKILHNKVHANIYSLIPKGNKVLAWFTYDKGSNVCLFMHINKFNNIQNVEPISMCFDKELSYGTILYGTYFTCKDNKFFTCEDILYFKGVNVENNEFEKKLNLLNTLFTNDIQQKAYNKNFVIFGLPYMNNNLHNTFLKIKEIPYNIYSIGFHQLNLSNKIGIIINKQINSIENIFKIKANIEQDIYSLHCKYENGNDFYSYAGIFNYKTSILMNNLFRSIKENKNLDLLEESDEEEEFENTNEDKFVNLKKIVYMKCIYNKKFRKWYPVEVVRFGEKLISKNEIQKIEQECHRK